MSIKSVRAIFHEKIKSQHSNIMIAIIITIIGHGKMSGSLSPDVWCCSLAHWTTLNFRILLLLLSSFVSAWCLVDDQTTTTKEIQSAAWESPHGENLRFVHKFIKSQNDRVSRSWNNISKVDTKYNLSTDRRSSAQFFFSSFFLSFVFHILRTPSHRISSYPKR